MLSKIFLALRALRYIRLVVVLVAALSGAAYSNRSSISKLLPTSGSSNKPPLRDVLPGRWKGEYKGHNFMITFGRHSEVSMVMDVPLDLRARIGVDQLWFGGNYHVENDQVVNCQWTDGRWAEMLAQMGGMPLHQVGVKSYDENEMTDAEDTKWKCIGHAPAGKSGEAVDIADQAPAISDAPRAKGAGAPVSSKTLYDQQQKLTVLYSQLEIRRKKLNPKDKNAVAAFNKAAEQYSREVAAFNAGNRATATPPAPSSSPSAPPPVAAAR